MGHILSKILPFLASVFQHWHIWLSGGGLGGLVVICAWLIEKLFDKSLSKKSVVYLFLVGFFLGSCFLSWVDKDDALIQSKKWEADQAAEFQREIGNLRGEYADLKGRCQYQAGVMDTLGKQNRDQQNTINNCQTQAIKLLTPSEQKTTVLFFDKEDKNEIKTVRFLLLTNKSVTPVNMRVVCNAYLETAMIGPIGSGNMSMGAGPARLAPNAFDLSVESPAWTPTTPFVAIVHYGGDKDIMCSFVPR